MNASKRWCVPSQTKRHLRRSTAGWKVAAYRFDVLHLLPEGELHAEFGATGLEDGQQALPADAAEAVATGGDGAALEVNVDVVPVVERLDDGGVGLGVGLRQVAERLAGEDHAPAEGVVGAVPLEDGDVVGGVALLHEKGEVQARRTAADARDAHGGNLTLDS